MDIKLDLLPITDIRIDGNTQCRELISSDWVTHICDLIKDEIVMEPIKVCFDGVCYWLWDGFHRYHAHMQLGVKEVQVEITPGTKEEAQVLAMSANSKHGRPRTRADRRKAVELALENPITKDQSDSEIARRCDVSKSFVGAVRNPEVAKKQKENLQKTYEKKARKASEPVDEIPGAGPDEQELKASDLATQKDYEALQKLLDSDNVLQAAWDEVTRLNKVIADHDLRFNGLMNERNELIKDVKRLQAENDRLKAKLKEQK